MDSSAKRYRSIYSSRAFTSKSHFNFDRHKLKCRHKRRHCLDKSGKRDETMKSKYEVQASRLEAGLRDVTYQENDFRNHSAEMLTIFEDEDESVSERVPSFILKFADIPLRVAKHGDG